jgi:molybdopterin molybdotransferase
MTTGGAHDDPRMRGFRTRTSVDAVLDLIARRFGPPRLTGWPLGEVAGRVLARDVVSTVDVPAFDRAAMDGFALRGEETFGADAYSPIAFDVIGRVRPGREPSIEIGPGQAAEIATGAPMPRGADTVVKVESTESDGRLVRVFEPCPPGRHVGRRGEDIAEGDVALKSGRVLRPQDLGLLSSIGEDCISIFEPPDVTILVTGDELLPSGTPPADCRIADANFPMLKALVERDGGVVIGRHEPLADDREVIRKAILDAIVRSDLTLISGGTSTGPEDHAPGIIAEIGELAVHGVAIRPASPTGLGFIMERPIILLPGNPVSCLCAYDFFAGPIIRRLGGRSPDWPYRSVELPMGRKLASVVGRVDYARVSIVEGRVEPLAISGASILSSTTRADGFVVVPADLEGYAEGTRVNVWLYDS